MIIPPLFISAALIVFMPYTAPNIWMFIALRATMMVLLRLVLVKPLLIDYVKSQSLGLGMTFETYGYVFGEFIMITLFSASRSMEMKNQYLLPAFTIVFLATLLIFMIREPEIREGKNLPDGSRIVFFVDYTRSRWEHFK